MNINIILQPLSNIIIYNIKAKEIKPLTKIAKMEDNFSYIQ